MIKAATKSPEETQALAAALFSVMQSRDVILLIGDMGAGKTTFVKGLGKAMGVEDPITSPTFVLLHSYSGVMPLHHADLYRLDKLQEVLDIGIMELIDEGGVAVIEWGDRGVTAFPADALHIHLRVDDDDDTVRHYELQPRGPSWSVRESAIGRELSQWIVGIQ